MVGCMDTSSASVATLPGAYADARGPSGEQRRAAQVENINYLALAGCMAVSNLWFLLSVLQFT